MRFRYSSPRGHRLRSVLACAECRFCRVSVCPNLGGRRWTNIAIAGFTLFGLAAYVFLWRYIRKVM
jgi:hypothetical protein